MKGHFPNGSVTIFLLTFVVGYRDTYWIIMGQVLYLEEAIKRDECSHVNHSERFAFRLKRNYYHRQKYTCERAESGIVDCNLED